jgi:hypothetical protein
VAWRRVGKRWGNGAVGEEGLGSLGFLTDEFLNCQTFGTDMAGMSGSPKNHRKGRDFSNHKFKTLYFPRLSFFSEKS